MALMSAVERARARCLCCPPPRVVGMDMAFPFSSWWITFSVRKLGWVPMGMGVRSTCGKLLVGVAAIVVLVLVSVCFVDCFCCCYYY